MKRSALAFALLLVAHPIAAADENSARDAVRRGMAAFARGDAQAALLEYEAAKQLAPDANAPYLFAAEALAALGRWPDVVANLEEYLRKNPNEIGRASCRERV